MKHLVTGGSGFLGNLIAKRLHEQGDTVKVLDIRQDDTLKGIEFYKCDIHDREGVKAALNGIDIVHHTAASVPLLKSRGKFQRNNVTGTEIIAEESVKAGVQAFVHMSSSAIYGKCRNFPITNDTQPVPAEPYGKSKLAGENAVKKIAGHNNMPLIVIRPRTILGHGRLGIFQIFFDWIRTGHNIYTIGNGQQKFQFIHADDLMDFYMMALKLESPGTYNVGTDRYGTLREVYENLIQHAGSQTKIRCLPETMSITALTVLDKLKLSPLAPWHYLTYHMPFYFDVDPLIKMGWTPKYSNNEMFRESYDWFINNRGIINTGKDSSPHRQAVNEKILRIVKWFSR